MKTPLILSLLLLADCVALYYLLGFTGFPLQKVLTSILPAFGVWALSALVDKTRYFTVLDFLGTMIFGCTVFTGMQFLFAQVN